MSVWFSWVAGILMFLIAIAYVIITIVTNRRKAEEEPEPNAIILHNIPKKYLTNGHDDLLILKHRENRNGTTWIKALPRDVRQGENMKPVPPVTFVLLTENIIKHARGEASNHREEWWVVSKDLTDYPVKMRDTIDAKYLTSEGIKAHIVETFKPTVREMDLGISEGMKEIAGGQFTDIAIRKIREDSEAKARASAMEKPDKEK